MGVLAAGVVFGGDSWPQFRGPTQEGHTDATGLPVVWSEAQNIKWKSAIPGEGWSSPVILDGQIWMTTALEGGRSLRAICVDQVSGKIMHDIELFRPETIIPKNSFNSHASPTPVLEKGRCYVTFGTNGFAAIDTATGQVLWKNMELTLDHKEGPGSSPILYKDLLILHCDGTDVQYVAALDKKTGKIAWKTDRTTNFGNKVGDLRKAYCTPLIINVNGKDQMISVGASRVFAYDPNTGKEIWSAAHPGYSNVPRPSYANGLVYISSGYNKADLLAIRPDGAGDVTATHVAWKYNQGVPCKPSFALVGEQLYMVSDNGIARCLNATTGEMVWTARLGTAFTASPIVAEGLVYFFSEKGVTTIIKPGPALEVVAENLLEGRIMASPAVVEKAIYLRTATHLYRIEK